MTLQLILTLEGIKKYYGDIPEVTDYPDKYEEYSSSKDGIDEYLDEKFAMPINDICNSLLGYSDVDYLDSEKCKKIVPWIEKNLETFIDLDGKKVVEKILEFAKRAIELNTGIIIEL